MLNYLNFNPSNTTNHSTRPQGVDKNDLVQFVRCPRAWGLLVKTHRSHYYLCTVSFVFSRSNVWENRRQQSIFLPLSHH